MKTCIKKKKENSDLPDYLVPVNLPYTHSPDEDIEILLLTYFLRD